MSEFTVRKNAIAINVSRDMLLLHGLVEPTEDEKREQDAWHSEYVERRQVAARKIPDAILALDALSEPTARLVLDHHARSVGGIGWTCYGCDQGCSCDSPGWPCSTVGEVASLHGIDLTDSDMFGRPADGSLDLDEGGK